MGGLRIADVPHYDLDENLVLHVGPTFRTLAPIGDRTCMRSVVEGIDAMAKEEAADWRGMAMHCKPRRRLLSALRNFSLSAETKI